MILVTLGTQDKKFTRLLQELDRLIAKKVIKDKVVVQAGYSADYKSKKMEIFDLISSDEFEQLIAKCDLLITHGGVGAILTGLKNQKKVIAIPRLKKYKEHVNDHQIQIIENFQAEGYILGCMVEELEETFQKVKDFQPKKFQSNKEKSLNLIKKLIEEEK